MEFAADSILVLLDTTTEGVLAKSSAALLGAAASVGTPVALIVAGEAEAAGLAAAAAELGAAAVLQAPARAELGRGAADALAAAAALVRPDAVLASHSVEGREAAARFAARTRSGLIADAIGVARDTEGVTALNSAYGGAYTVGAAVTHGAPVITVRQGAVEARAEAKPLSAVALDVPVSDARTAIHLTHRLGALVLTVVLLGLAWQLRRVGMTRLAGLLMLALGLRRPLMRALELG